MINLLTNIEAAQKELDNLINGMEAFADCHFEKPAFKTWKEDVLSFISRTYDVSESNEKKSTFNGIQFWSAGWESYLESVGVITPENSGIGEAAAILLSWKDDLAKRKGEHHMDRIRKIIQFIIGIAVAGGILLYGIVYIRNSNQHVVNNGSIGNISLGDGAAQVSEQK